MDALIPKHGGYRSLKSFQVAQLAYDMTVRFCERYVDRGAERATKWERLYRFRQQKRKS